MNDDYNYGPDDYFEYDPGDDGADDEVLVDYSVEMTPELYAAMYAKAKKKLTLPKYMLKHTGFRTHQSDTRRTNWKATDFNLFALMTSGAARSLKWHKRHPESGPVSADDFFVAKTQLAYLHNFLFTYERRIRRDNTPFSKKLRECRSLASSKSSYMCRKQSICPFCQFARQVIPFYDAVREECDRYDKDNYRLVYVRFAQTTWTQGPNHLSKQLPKVLDLRERIQDINMLRRCRAKWFRISLLGKREPRLYLAHHCLFLVRKDLVSTIALKLEDFKGFRKTVFTSYSPLQPVIQKQVSRFFVYPDWLVRIPLDRIERYLATPLYKLRVKK